MLGSALVVFAVLLLGARLLLARPAPDQALWPGAIVGAAAVTVVLNVRAPLPARLVTKAGPAYGSFATVAGMFALLYLVGQALVYAAEVAAVRHAGCGRALDLNRPTAADARAVTLLAREQERIPAARVGFHLAARASAPVPGGSRQPAMAQANAKASRSGRRAKDFDATVRAGGAGQIGQRKGRAAEVDVAGLHLPPQHRGDLEVHKLRRAGLRARLTRRWRLVPGHLAVRACPAVVLHRVLRARYQRPDRVGPVGRPAGHQVQRAVPPGLGVLVPVALTVQLDSGS